jgi:serine kinase of HPr protein (carbohydrate metabolism regulator)
MEGAQMVFAASAVAVGGRALAIEGPPGSGKSSLALALIDRGAVLIGDDAIALTRAGERLVASAPPNIAGKIELRGIGLFDLAVADPVPLALVLSLGVGGERLPEAASRRELLGIKVPCLPFYPGAIAPAIRAEWALERFGLARP